MKREGTKSHNYRKHRVGIVSALVIFLLIIFVIFDYFFIVRKGIKVLAPSSEQNSTDTTDQTQPSMDSKTQDSEATNYYNDGLTKFNTKKYAEAIIDFSDAIRMNPKIDLYYSKKSQAQMNLGDRQASIETIRDGLKILPDSDLLNTRLEILLNTPNGNQDGIK